MGAKNKQRGFTIVELLVVIVVIAILVAIVIATFSGISERAHIATIKSDLSNAAKTLTMASVDSGTFPADLASTGLKASPGTVYQYTYTSADNSYCLTATNSNIAYMVSTSDSSATAGVCPGHTGPSAPGSNGGAVTTLAGTSFDRASAVATDTAGNIYVADYGHHRICKITTGGVVSTLAGSGVRGFADGAGASAQFNYPDGVTVDSNGNIYVGDYGNNRIRKITPGGVVSTLAGSGVAGFADGTGTSAQFNYPHGVAVDSSGTVYVGDATNHRVRKITPGGAVSTLAGSGVAAFADGTGTSAQFYSPSGVAVDSTGTVYVGESVNDRIRKITPGGVVSTLAGSGRGFADGAGTSAQFSSPGGIAIDLDKNVYVADSMNNRIRKITPGGVVSTLAGSGVAGFADGTGTSAQFSSPSGVAVDSTGIVYVGDKSNSLIRKIQP